MLLQQEGRRKKVGVPDTCVEEHIDDTVMMKKKMMINMKAHTVLHVEMMMKENQNSKSYGLHVIFAMHGISCHVKV